MNQWKREWPWWALFLAAAAIQIGGYGIHTPRFGLGLLAALAPVLPVFLLLRWLDRIPPLGTRGWIRALGWGFIVAPVVASSCHTMVQVVIEGTAERASPFDPAEAASLGRLAGSILSAPVAEETLKALLPLWFLCRKSPFSGPWPTLLVGSVIALSFGLVESAVQLAKTLLPDRDAGEGFASLLGQRALLPYLHAVFSLPLLLAIGGAVFLPTLSRRLALVLSGWLGAVALHGLWNWEVLLGKTDFSLGAVILHADTASPFVLLAAILLVFALERRLLAAGGVEIPGVLRRFRGVSAERIGWARGERFERSLLPGPDVSPEVQVTGAESPAPL